MKYTLSVTLSKYANNCQIYRDKRNRFHNNFSMASRLRLIKLANSLSHRTNKIDSNYYFWSN